MITMSNVFVVIDCKNRKPILATPSAGKAHEALNKGVKIEIWVDNIHLDTAYSWQPEKLKPFILQEKQYIARKQKRAEDRNKRRKRNKTA